MRRRAAYQTVAEAAADHDGLAPAATADDDQQQQPPFQENTLVLDDAEAEIQKGGAVEWENGGQVFEGERHVHRLTRLQPRPSDHIRQDRGPHH